MNNALGRPKKKKIIGRLKRLSRHHHRLGVADRTARRNHRSFDVPLPGFIHTLTPHHYHGANLKASPRRISPHGSPMNWNR